MDHLKVDTDVFANMRDELSRTGRTIDSILDDFDRDNTRLDQTWTGEAADAYRDKAAQWRDNVISTKQNLTQIVTVVGEMKTTYESCETACFDTWA